MEMGLTSPIIYCQSGIVFILLAPLPKTGTIGPNFPRIALKFNIHTPLKQTSF